VVAVFARDLAAGTTATIFSWIEALVRRRRHRHDIRLGRDDRAAPAPRRRPDGRLGSRVFVSWHRR